MTIEIHQPELEALIQQRMASGRFQSIEEFLLKIIEAAPEEKALVEDTENLDQIFALIRGMFADGELDFSRNPSSARPVDLS